MASKFMMLAENGVEEMEAIVLLDLLRRALITVDFLTPGPTLELTGRNKIGLRADGFFKSDNWDEYGGLIIPGGMGNVNGLKSNSLVLEVIQKFHQEKKWIFSLCAGPLVLKEAGILKEAKLTSFPSVKEELIGYIGEYSEQAVCEDGPILTSRGAGTAREFAFFIVEKLLGAESLKRLQKEIVYSA